VRYYKNLFKLLKDKKEKIKIIINDIGFIKLIDEY
jgi:hypothetical protein